MRTFSIAACMFLLSICARAQSVAPRILSIPASMSAPSALSASASAKPFIVPALVSPAFAAPSFLAGAAVDAPPLAAAPALNPISAPALAAPPALDPFDAPALAAAPALEAGNFAAAASSLETGKSPSGVHAAAAASEFWRLVGDLMSGNSARSRAATVELNKIKEAHLNRNPEPEKAKVTKLKPMQIPGGMFEIKDKAVALRDMKKKEADEWLEENSIPHIEDYKDRKRPVDHHHEARAAWEAGFKKVYTHRYFDDWLHRKIKGLTREEFYAVTRAMGLFYDLDQFGAGPHDPNHLPEDVRGLADDPFRSVAWQVRKRDGYLKSSVPFAEFRWAKFFRARVKTYPSGADFEKSVREAMRIVHDPAAKGLPGYKPK
ncbi:MAG: ParB-like protein [Elusimicrobiota bacterium]